MPKVITFLNLDMLTGNDLFKEICESIEAGEGIAKKIEDKVLNEGGWNVKDFPEEMLASGKILGDTVRIPKKQPFKNCEVAINAMTYHLLIKVGNQWRQTRFVIKTKKIETAKA